MKQINSDGNFTYSKIVKIDFTKNIFIKITPNPVQQYLNINSSTFIKEIRLISLNGNLINSWTNVAATSKLDVSSVATGVYILRIITADEVISQKIMKE